MQTALPKLLLLVALCALVACERGTLAPVPPGSVILAFGDSLTVGVGAKPSQSYPSVLAQLSGRQVINAGVSGEVTAEGLARLEKLLQKQAVDLLILLEGGNDILRNKKPAQTKANLARMIETARLYNTQIVLIGVPEKKLFSSVAPFYKELAEEYELVFEGEILGDLLRQAKYKSDSVHLNAEGYRVMAETIYELLLEQGAF